jgi:hypothetical protein
VYTDKSVSAQKRNASVKNKTRALLRLVFSFVSKKGKKKNNKIPITGRSTVPNDHGMAGKIFHEFRTPIENTIPEEGCTERKNQ